MIYRPFQKHSVSYYGENRGPYNSQNPNEYTYVSGYGFAPPPPQVSERRLLRAYSSALGGAILGFLFLSMFLPGLVLNFLGMFVPSVRLYNYQVIAPPFVSELASGVTYCLALMAPFVLYSKFVRIPSRMAVPLKQPTPKVAIPAVCVGLGATVVGAFSASTISSVFSAFGYLPTSPELAVPSGLGAVILFFINSALLPAVLEEVVFRGIVMQSLRRFGDGFALLASSAVFALIHGNFVQAPSAFVVGLAMGYFVMLTGSLRVGIAIHFINNGVAVLASILTLYAGDTTQIAVTYLVYGCYLILALIGLLSLIRHQTDLFVIRPAETVTPEKEKFVLFFTSAGMLMALILLAIVAGQSLAAL